MESPIYFSLLFFSSIVATADGNPESLEDVEAFFMLDFLAALIVGSGAIRMWLQCDFVFPVIGWQTAFSLKKVNGIIWPSGRCVCCLL